MKKEIQKVYTASYSSLGRSSLGDGLVHLRDKNNCPTLFDSEEEALEAARREGESSHYGCRRDNESALEQYVIRVSKYRRLLLISKNPIKLGASATINMCLVKDDDGHLVKDDDGLLTLQRTTVVKEKAHIWDGKGRPPDMEKARNIFIQSGDEYFLLDSRALIGLRDAIDKKRKN